MPVADFLRHHAASLLKRGDIVLSRSPTPASRLIRLLSGNTFSHAAMVFFLPREQEEFSHTFVIESLFQGVGLASLDSYVQGRNAVEEAGILRLEGEGFSPDFFRAARGFMLNELHKPYDYHRLFGLGFKTLFGLDAGWRRVAGKPRVYKAWMPRQFICSGFIQFGYYKAAIALGLDVNRAVLRDGAHNPSREEMLATTPEDLATSAKLRWEYVIRKGWIYRVADYDAAKRVISGGRS
ncbi:MAG: hypothetical protein KGO53_09185 [Alphaproteobacteria bacterium]|nr:hypothetical protein [Alphaproteobacteria bacterium]